MPNAERLYIGSSFCDRYFVYTNPALWEKAVRKAGERKMKVTLVVPSPSQRYLAAVKDLTSSLLMAFPEDIDEIVANDYAMIAWAASAYPEIKLWCGRILHKDTRDPRYKGETGICKLLDHIADGKIFGCRITGIEADMVNSLRLDKTDSVMLGVHMGYTYVSMGRLCEFSGISRPIKHKFRLDEPCARQCNYNWISYCDDAASFLKYGRAVYTKKNSAPMILGDTSTLLRYIYDGFADWIDIQNHSFDTDWG